MAAASAISTQDEKFKSLGLQKMVVNEEHVYSYSRSLGAASNQNPVLMLIHGYPQSSYMWRHLIPRLPKDAPLFVPDLPGYGASAPIEKYDKLSVGETLISALKTEVKRTSSKPASPIPVVLIGHDRGARVVHRLTVSGVEGIDILGACLIDIVPSTEQWSAFAQSDAILGYFHFPFLANVDLANRMIGAFGGENWCREMTLRWAGKNPQGISSLKADNALDVYAGFFTQPHVIDATNKDYEAGATVDLESQKEDQKARRKVKVPLLLIYSGTFIGSRFQWPDVWRPWVDDGVKIDHHALGGGIGHFGAEEDPENTAKVLGKWLEGLGGK